MRFYKLLKIDCYKLKGMSMTFARIAAERGHETFLIERNNKLGGNVDVASITGERPHYGNHIQWLERRLSSLNVKVSLNTEVSFDVVNEINPDTIIIATGSKTINPYEVVENHYNIVHDTDVLSGSIKIERDAKVLVYDRDATFRGGSVANFLAENGAVVEIACPQWSLADKLDDFRKAEINKIIGSKDINVSVSKELIAVDNKLLVLKDMWRDEERTINKDELIVLVGFQTGDNGLYMELKKNYPNIDIHQIGDSIAPRQLYNIIKESTKLALNL